MRGQKQNGVLVSESCGLGLAVQNYHTTDEELTGQDLPVFMDNTIGHFLFDNQCGLVRNSFPSVTVVERCGGVKIARSGIFGRNCAAASPREHQPPPAKGNWIKRALKVSLRKHNPQRRSCETPSGSPF
mmetsp:Transcript_14136/g.32112  ORF Transcript_14136/g.32112 Transcript_14136/m.32112 type:complete len:129 (+) Transcript_14136:63-449(+)